MTNLISKIFKKDEKQKNSGYDKTLKITDNEARKKVIDYINKNEGEEAAKAIGKGDIKISNMGEMGLIMVSTVRYFFVSKKGVEETKELNEGDIISHTDGKINIHQ